MHSHCKHGMTELLRSKITFFANSKMAAALAVTKMRRQGFFQILLYLDFVVLSHHTTTTYQVHTSPTRRLLYCELPVLFTSNFLIHFELHFLKIKLVFLENNKSTCLLVVAENRLNGRMMMKQTFQLMNTRLETALRGKITKQQ